jgi:hypothetical protein
MPRRVVEPHPAAALEPRVGLKDDVGQAAPRRAHDERAEVGDAASSCGIVRCNPIRGFETCEPGMVRAHLSGTPNRRLTQFLLETEYYAVRIAYGSQL